MMSFLKPPFIPPAWLLASALIMVLLRETIPGPSLGLDQAAGVGWFLIGGGIALAVFVDLIFKRRGTTILPFRESTALVTSGPFRYSRNPIYCGMIAMLIGLGVLLDSATPFVIVPVFGWIIDRYFIRREEADLETVFGAEYEAYKARVRRWL